jgi:hypothetical protein
MQQHQLQHVILEIGRRFDLRDFYIVGSAAILAALPDPPAGSLTATLGLVRREELLARLDTVKCTDDHRKQITARVNALFR